jgi:membrane fusion protein (multidrug efflux system)
LQSCAIPSRKNKNRRHLFDDPAQELPNTFFKAIFINTYNYNWVQAMQIRKAYRYLSIFAMATLLLACGGDDKNQVPPKVTVEEVKKQDVSDTKTYIATIKSIITVDLVPRVEGFLLEQLFVGGDDVEAGQLLFKIQQDEYIANLKQAQADLYSAKATLTNNKLNLDRIRDLTQKEFASQSEEDRAEADYETALADVEAAEAELINAELDLSYTEIYSPINGRIGYTKVDVGTLVAPRTGVLTTVVKLNPIYAEFSISESDLLNFKLQNISDSQQQINESFTPVIKFQNGETYPLEGYIESMDNQIDAGTGSIIVRAVFENNNAILLPGQFVNVILRKGEPRYALTVPAQAVLYDKQGYYVLIVNEDDTVEQKYIEEGVVNNKFVEALSGLQEGDRVIIDGIQKAQPGVQVEPINTQQQAQQQKQKENNKEKRERDRKDKG